ncbi:MAG TPA: hypothetical protein VLJ39_18575, partial [Tepidisphaeraceae bacterium]|nr:hypothetical protein [Tepidisphaeraceae bacterium]
MFFELRGRMAPFGAGPPMGTLTWIPPGVDKHSSRSSDMRKAIAANVVRTARWHSLLEPPADRAKSDLYLGVLKARAKPTARFAVYGIGPTDWIASAAASRLDEIGDRDLALRALYADPSRASAFQNLFATREGREFLLKRLTDRSIPLDRRLAMSKELQFCLFQYFKEAVHAERNPREAQAAPAPDPGFVTGLAKAAVASHDNEEPLSAEILRDIVEFLPWTFNGGVTAIQPDLDRAGNILEPLM